MKLLIETTGKFSLLMGDGQEVSSRRPHVVMPDHFVHTRLGRGQLRVLAQVTEAATDEEFARYWAEAEKDKGLAVSSFESAFSLEAEATEEVAPSASQLEILITELISANPEKLVKLAEEPRSMGWWVGQVKKALPDADIDAAKELIKAAMPAQEV